MSFKDGKVDGYTNNGNLKVKVSPETTSGSVETHLDREKAEGESHTVQSMKSSGPSKKKNEVRYVYFRFTGTASGIYDELSGGKIRGDDYTDIFIIEDYSQERQDDLEFCLTKAYKSQTGRPAFLEARVFDDRKLTQMLWNNETGSLFSSHFCGGYGRIR